MSPAKRPRLRTSPPSEPRSPAHSIFLNLAAASPKPGPIWAPLQVGGGATQEKLQKFGGQTPLGRPGQPAELAGIYVQLAASDGSYATGNVYGAGGGSGQP